LRWNKNKDGALEIEPIQEHNSIVHCMMASVDQIIEAAFSNSAAEDTTMNLTLACVKYCEAMQLLMLHRILTDDEQQQFQDLIDNFFQIWVDLFSTEGITNYNVCAFILSKDGNT